MPIDPLSPADLTIPTEPIRPASTATEPGTPLLGVLAPSITEDRIILLRTSDGHQKLQFPLLLFPDLVMITMFPRTRRFDRSRSGCLPRRMVPSPAEVGTLRINRALLAHQLGTVRYWKHAANRSETPPCDISSSVAPLFYPANRSTATVAVEFLSAKILSQTEHLDGGATSYSIFHILGSDTYFAIFLARKLQPMGLCIKLSLQCLSESVSYTLI